MTIDNRSDIVGAVASSLCFIHCLATPFIFVAQSCSTTCCESSPIWWSGIDYLFLTISFFAVYWSVQTTSKGWMKYALCISWVFLLLIIVF